MYKFRDIEQRDDNQGEVEVSKRRKQQKYYHAVGPIEDRIFEVEPIFMLKRVAKFQIPEKSILPMDVIGKSACRMYVSQPLELFCI